LLAAGPTEAITKIAAEITAENAAVMLFEEMENMMGVPKAWIEIMRLKMQRFA
jgi:hypothetical protein